MKDINSYYKKVRELKIIKNSFDKIDSDSKKKSLYLSIKQRMKNLKKSFNSLRRRGYFIIDELNVQSFKIKRKKLNSKNAYLKYKNYINSDRWRKKRIEFFKSEYFLGYCHQCKRKMNAYDVHHKTYKNLYDEKLDELIALCRNCHKKVHHCKSIRSLRL